MSTTVYFVRHCEPNYKNHDDSSRELTQKGLQDRQFIIKFFENKLINHIFSSPYKRAFDTVLPLAKQHKLNIITVDDFKERKIDNVWIEDFKSFTQKQWFDFSYKLTDGECLHDVQQRNMRALNQLLIDKDGQSLVIGSHGTAISTIINFFFKSYGYQDFENIKSLMPYIAEFQFNKLDCQSISIHNIFTGACHEIYSI
ncbi:MULTISPECIES: histidine phosphatase family protein [Streptococcus]|uniref:Histidine phosphatase family protein n=1 Tax=Streptococcus caledonicus TaxID=2614158 RepID=A0ABW0UEH6_9STRE|nr:histidine phosphatase family protein [Streptococcus sp. S784/96/1]